MGIYASLIKAKSNVNWDELYDVQVDLTGRAAWAFGSGGEGYDYFIGEYGFEASNMVEDYLRKRHGNKHEIIVYGYHAVMDVRSINEIVILVDRINFTVTETDGGYRRNHKCRVIKSFKQDWSWLLEYIDPGKEWMIKNGEFKRVGTTL